MELSTGAKVVQTHVGSTSGDVFNRLSNDAPYVVQPDSQRIIGAPKQVILLVLASLLCNGLEVI